MIKSFDYIKPKSWREAAEALDAYGHQASVLAGGTDLLPAMKLNLRKPEVLIDLKGITEPVNPDESLTDDKKFMALSPLITLSRLCHQPLIREKYPALALFSPSYTEIESPSSIPLLEPSLGNIT